MISVGELFEKERCKADVSRERLASGICNQQLLYRALVDGTDMSVLTFEMLLERLKQSTDVLEYILSQNEYERILMRDSIEEAVMNLNMETARELLKKYIDTSEKDNEVDRMYYNRMMAASYLYGEVSKENYELGKSYIEKAIKITLPMINLNNYDSYLFSTYEVENILMYIESLCLLGDIEKGVGLLVRSYDYIEKLWDNSSMLVRVIPKCVYLMLKYGNGIITDEELIKYCEKALGYLREETILFFLIPIMGKVITIYNRVKNIERAEYWKKYYVLMQELYLGFSLGKKEVPVFYRWKRTTYYLDYEVIRGERLNKGMKQSELADGIYGNPASISNVEKGKQTPNKTKYRQLCEKLLLDKPRYSGFVITDDFEKLERIARIRKALSAGSIDKVIELIETEELQNDVDRRILEAYRTIALHDLGKIDDVRAFAIMSESIEELYPLKNEKYLRRLFRGEIDIISAYLAILRRIDNSQAVLIIEKLIDVNKETKVVKRYCYRNCVSVYMAYLKSALKSGIKTGADDEFEENVKLCLEQGVGGALVGLFWSRGIQVKNTSGIDDAKMYFRYGYLLAELFLNKWAIKKKEYYEKVFNESQ